MQIGKPFNPYRVFTGIFIPEGLVRADGISPGAKLALGRLVRYGGQNGTCYPAVETLGAEIGVGERQARKYLAELEHAQPIRRVQRFSDDHGQTSNAFEFLWHSLFEEGVKNRSRGEGRNDNSARGRNDRSAKENQDEEKKLDLDYLATNLKKRDSQLDFQGRCAAHSKYPQLREALTGYLNPPGDKDRVYPSERQVVDVTHAAAGATEDEVIACLGYLYNERRLRPGTRHGPRHFSWFKTGRRRLLPTETGTILSCRCP